MRISKRLRGHQNTSKNFIRTRFGPGSALAVGGSEDGKVHVWDTDKGSLLQTLTGISHECECGVWVPVRCMGVGHCSACPSPLHYFGLVGLSRASYCVRFWMCLVANRQVTRASCMTLHGVTGCWQGLQVLPDSTLWPVADTVQLF